MPVEMESVMERLSAQTERLQEECRKSRGSDEDRALLMQGLVVLSEAVLRVGRDVRQLKLQAAADRQ